MEQPALFHDCIEDALREVVQACGGSKVVACKLWPEKTPDAAHRLLLACLNEDRPERLSPEHLILLLRMGRERGCHSAMAYVAGVCGYSAQPIEPEDERAALQRAFNESVRQQAELVARMERLAGPLLVRRSA